MSVRLPTLRRLKERRPSIFPIRENAPGRMARGVFYVVSFST